MKATARAAIAIPGWNEPSTDQSIAYLAAWLGWTRSTSPSFC